MKHLLTAIACCLAVAGSAQTPYNPDVDGDDCITVTDVLSILGLFNTCEDGYTFHYFKVGASTYPFSDLMGDGPWYLIGDSTYTPYTYSEGGFDLIMEDLINNADGTGLTPEVGTFIFSGPIDGMQGCNPTWTYNSSQGWEYLTVPANPVLDVNLVTDGLLEWNCGNTYNASERRAFTYNGESYWVYKLSNGQNDSSWTYGFK